MGKVNVGVALFQKGCGNKSKRLSNATEDKKVRSNLTPLIFQKALEVHNVRG